ncbi:MAG: GGDEF domain-containing protein [Clostridium sp.]|nr:GGDEF domain-containing protein [Clostridium sp.]MCM1208040.1 GGDEF domain-containing protein [Ruminococcus sp.]
MEKLDVLKFIKRKSIYRRIIYILMIAMLVISRLANIYMNTKVIVIYAFFLAVCAVLEYILSQKKSDASDVVLYVSKWVQLYAAMLFEYFVIEHTLLLVTTGLLELISIIELLLHKMDFDAFDIGMKKIFCALPAAVLAFMMYGKFGELAWIYYIVYKICSYVIAFYIVAFFVNQEKSYRTKNNKLQLENSNYESINAKLMEYQEKVEAVNEQINYQKIDLNRAYKDLEKANVEIESQTELMKYMASTFDVPECMKVIVDTIIEVKKAKICAMYIDKNVYMNNLPTCVVKSAYTSMTDRFKKEADDIFADFSSDSYYPKLFKNEQIRQFKFIGDTSLRAISVLPLIKDDKKYGYVMIGSDKEGFFDKGFTYYENCIMQFNISIKSILLYLQMRSMARRDGLTGIYNRVYFTELFEKAKASAKKYDYKLSVALFDIDKFKLVNDTYGHLAGDEVIKMVASIDDKYAEKHSGFACRYGGEEFLLVLPGKGKEEALEILESMHEEIKSTVVNFNGTEININVCVGLSVYPDICDNADILVARADKAMYYGKQNGRGRLVVDNPEIDAALG